MKDGKFQKVTAISFSPNNMRLAVTLDRVVYLYDENGEMKDHFKTRTKDEQKGAPATAAAKNYSVKSLAWSPDSQKLAVAQSDGCVYVYRLGTKWGEAKAIVNKFPMQAGPSQSSPVMCCVWPLRRVGEVVYGTADGKVWLLFLLLQSCVRLMLPSLGGWRWQVRVGFCKSNKTAVLYDAGSCVVSMAAGPDGSSLLSGHMDGNIYRYTFPDPDGQFGHSNVCAPCLPPSLSLAFSLLTFFSFPFLVCLSVCVV